MDNERMLEISEKIKNKTATEDEITEFTKEFTHLISAIRQDITKK